MLFGWTRSHPSGGLVEARQNALVRAPFTWLSNLTGLSEKTAVWTPASFALAVNQVTC